jgi:hypothetical protein
VQLGIQLAVSLKILAWALVSWLPEYLRYRIWHCFGHHLEDNSHLMTQQVTSETVEYLWMSPFARSAENILFFWNVHSDRDGINGVIGFHQLHLAP